ncbi:MAG: FAD-binding protein [Chloroflexi bacterium]|nr:FAD-binding protein [Chloroflexota bacterium]MCY3957774.1 FAD-binding protein [Chloroflexota bacterium]
MLEPESVADVQRAIWQARAAGTHLRIVGAGRVKRFESCESIIASRLSLRHLRAIQIVARDFTARVGAGLCPADLDAALRPFGLVWPLQRLEAPGTVAGLIASGRATTIGLQDVPARRWVLGARLVDGTGAVLTVGGATVKNSVGYGLTHALWASKGRLGAIVELTLRLRRRRPDDAPGPMLSPAALGGAAALVRCDDLAPGSVGMVRDGLPGASEVAVASDGWRVVGCYARRQAAETDAAALRARGIEVLVEPSDPEERRPTATPAARTALDPNEVFV